jgi:hypothetical protein
MKTGGRQSQGTKINRYFIIILKIFIRNHLKKIVESLVKDRIRTEIRKNRIFWVLDTSRGTADPDADPDATFHPDPDPDSDFI